MTLFDLVMVIFPCRLSVYWYNHCWTTLLY